MTRRPFLPGLPRNSGCSPKDDEEAEEEEEPFPPLLSSAVPSTQSAVAMRRPW